MALEAPEVMEVLDLNAITTRPWSIQACSAKTKEGLEEGITWMINTINTKSSANNAAAAQ